MKFGFIPVEDSRYYQEALKQVELKDRFIIGSPSRVIEQVDYFIEQFGMDHLICRLHFPGMPPDKVLAAVQLIAEEILPVFKNKAVEQSAKPKSS